MPIHPALQPKRLQEWFPPENEYNPLTGERISPAPITPYKPSLLARVLPPLRRLEQANYELVKQASDEGKESIAPRPVGDILQSYQHAGIRSPRNPYRISDLYWLSRVQPILRTSQFNIREEIFRRGLKWEPEFAYKCTGECETEYDEDPTPDVEEEQQEAALPAGPETPHIATPGETQQTVEKSFIAIQGAIATLELQKQEAQEPEVPEVGTPKEEVKKCPECEGTLREPDRKGIDDAEKFFKKVNANDQDLLTVLRQFEDDLNVTDDGYLILRKDFTLDKENKITEEKPVAFLRGNPDVMRITADRNDMLGGTYWFCPHHRKGPDAFVWMNPEAKDYEMAGFSPRGPARPEDKDIPPCEHDGGPLWEATYIATFDGVQPEYFYAEHEVIHVSKYEPTMTYGFSPVVTLWTLTTALLNIERYIQDYYRENRMPQGVLVVTTDNPNAAYRSWDITVQRSREDAWHVPMWAVSSQRGKGDAKFVEFRQTPQEMEMVAVRDEFRQRVSALYGVSNIFMGDVQTSGGLNAENLQIQVTNRALERGQRIYTDIVFPKLIKLFGVEDFKLTFPRLELSEEAEKMQVELANLQFAQGMSQLGFDVDVRTDEEGTHEFTYKKRPEQPEMGEEEGGAGMGGLAQRLQGMKPGESLEIGPEESRSEFLPEG